MSDFLNKQPNQDRILRLPELLRLIGTSRQWVYRKIKDGEFPPQIKLSQNGAVGWRQSHISLWLTERELASAPSDYSIPIH